METKLPIDIDTLRGWFNAMRSAKRKGRSSGASVVTIRAFCDERGDPIVYHVESKKLSPVSNTADFIALLEKMGG